MNKLLSHPIRIIPPSILLLGISWLTCSQLQAAQPLPPQPPARVMDLRNLLEESAGGEPRRFLSVRANDTGLFIWVESGSSPRSGVRTVTVHHITEAGGLLGSTPLPAGAGLTLTQDFGVDDAGNLYFLQTRSMTADADEIALVEVDARGEVVEEYRLAGRPATFAVGRQGRVFLLNDEAEISSPEAPTLAVLQANKPKRAASGPPRWLPLLEQTSSGKLVLVDGVTGTLESPDGFPPPPRRLLASAELRAVIRRISETQTENAAGSVQPALRNSCVDDTGTLSFTLMGTRPSEGVIVVRTDSAGNALAPLRLEAPLDTNRPQTPGRPRPEGEAALMYPQDLAVWGGKSFLLGIHGLLAVYELPNP